MIIESKDNKKIKYLNKLRTNGNPGPFIKPGVLTGIKFFSLITFPVFLNSRYSGLFRQLLGLFFLLFKNAK